METCELNPADDASHGLNVEPFLKSTRWRKGTEYLEREDWPEIPKKLEHIPPDDPEVKKYVFANSGGIEEKNPTNLLIEYYSSWSRLQRGVAWILKWRGLLLLLN